MNGGAGLPEIVSARSGDEELRRLAVIFATTPNAVIREACGFYLSCLACQMEDPPPSMTCRLGRDHRVGTTAGCPACGRLTAACAARPCSAAPAGRAREGTP